MVGLPEQYAGSHVAWDEGEICPVVAIEDGFGASGSDGGHERIIVVRVATVKPVGHFESIAVVDDVGEVFVGEAGRDTEIDNSPVSGPVPPADGHSVRILLVLAVEVFFVFLNIRSELFFVRRVHVGDGFQGRHDVAVGVVFQCHPDSLREVIQVLFFTGRGV